MSAANGGTGGQAPASSQQTGQAPQANNTSAPSGAPQGQAPDGNTQSSSALSSGQQLSQADYDRIIADLRKENASHRTENTRVAAELKRFQDAQLTDQQKRERDYADMQAKNFEYEARLQQQSLQLAGYRLGSQLGIGDVGAALALVQAEHAAEIKYAADGDPENLSDLLKAVLKDHPVLAGRATPPPSSGGASNPGRQAGNGGLTLEMIRAMPMRERVARIDEITAWEKAHRQSSQSSQSS